MNHFRSVGITLIVLSMGVGSLASAQGHERGHSDRDEHSSRSDRRDHRDDSSDRADVRERRDDRSQGSDVRDRRDERSRRSDLRDRRDIRSQRSDDRDRRGSQAYNQRGEWRDQRGEWRGAGPRHEFRRGTHLTRQYRSRQYLVQDWRGHRLSAPPRGYHWVQTGPDHVLAAIATGLIVQIVLNN